MLISDLLASKTFSIPIFWLFGRKRVFKPTGDALIEGFEVTGCYTVAI